MSKSVLVVGAGRMGYGVIKTLLLNNNVVYVSDPSSEAVERAVGLGAKQTTNLNDVLATVDCVFLSLPSPAIVADTTAKIKAAASEKKFIVVDLSTIDPKTAIDAHGLLKEAGLGYLEAPVSGGPQGAETGTLSIMVGGDQADYEAAFPLLEQVGKSVFYLGKVGSGSLAKICNNIVVASTTAVLSEAFILAAAGGISPEKLKNILENSVGGSKTLDVFGEHMVTGDFSKATFALGLMHKDVGLFMEAIKQYDVTSLIGSLTYQIYNGSMQLEGLKFEDHTAILKYIEMLNNKEINRESLNEEAVN